MRGLRRIAGDCRCSNEVRFNDLQIRLKLNVASIDCLLMCALAVFGRLVRPHPPTLCAALHVHEGLSVLPWVALVTRDCNDMVARGLLPPSLGDFGAHPERWHTLIASDPVWPAAVHALFFYRVGP